MNYHLILTLVSASALPALALLGVFLRTGLLQGKTKTVVLILGLSLLLYTVFETFKEHSDGVAPLDILLGVVTTSLTLFVLSRFHHGHTHAKEEDGARGIAISEAFHSIVDGTVIGATYLVSPVIGGAATVGIMIHELPKILGTLAVFRSLGLSVRQTIMYGIFAQIGSPLAAVLVFMLGQNFSEEQFHALEIVSVSSLGAIVLWIIYLEYRHHKRHTSHKH